MARGDTLPAELIRPHVQRYLDTHQASSFGLQAGTERGEVVILAEDAGVSYVWLKALLRGELNKITFSYADKLLCRIGEVERWYAPPLLEHYDRILVEKPVKHRRRSSPSRKQMLNRAACKRWYDKQPKKPCKDCGGVKEPNYRSPYCKPCAAARTAARGRP